MIVALLAVLSVQGAPAFSFREVNSSTTQESALAAGLLDRTVRCRPDELNGNPFTSCAASSQMIRAGIGGQRIFDIALGFDGNGLATFKAITFPESSDAIAASLTAKFGEPCEIQSKTLQNVFGAQIPQVVSTWCLADGRLTFESVWSINMDRARVVFAATRMAQEAGPPIVDF